MPKFIVEEGEIEPQDFNRLRKSVGWEEHNFNDVFLSLKNTLYLVIAKNEKHEIIGMARIIGDQGMYFYIQDVIVLPDYQKQNVGFELMKKIMTYIEKNKKENMFIGLMAAKGKEGFYKKFGFVERPAEKYGPGMCLE